MPSLTNAVIAALLAVSTVVVAARLATAPRPVATAPQSASLSEAPSSVPPTVQARRAPRGPSAAGKCLEVASRGRNGSSDPACAKSRGVPELPPRSDRTLTQVVPEVGPPGAHEGTENEADLPVTPERLMVEGPAPAVPEWRPRIPDGADRFTVRHLRDVVAYLKSLEGAAGSEP